MWLLQAQVFFYIRMVQGQSFFYIRLNFVFALPPPAVRPGQVFFYIRLVKGQLFFIYGRRPTFVHTTSVGIRPGPTFESSLLIYDVFLYTVFFTCGFFICGFLICWGQVLNTCFYTTSVEGPPRPAPTYKKNFSVVGR